MPFPAISDAIREWWSGRNDGPMIQPLGLKEIVTFDSLDAAWYARNGFYGIYDRIGGGNATWSGESVSTDTAQNHSVVWACKRIISESVAFLPLVMMRETDAGKFPAKDKPMYLRLKMAPNAEMTSMNLREAMTGHCVLGGNAYAEIVRRSGSGVATELHPLQPSQVNVCREKTGKRRIVYEVKDGNSATRSYTVEDGKPHDILHVPGLGGDGIVGDSVIKMARQSIGTAIGAEKFAGRFWANGGRAPYRLELQQGHKFASDAEFEKFRSDWDTVYKDPHRAPIIEPWFKYEQMGMSLQDCQLLGSRQFSIPEICRWFLISPHLVGDLSRATFSNIEELAMQFVTFTLTAWLLRWEQNLWRCVLTPDEQSQGYYFKHNLSGLLRGDFVSRMAGYASALQNGHLSIDEVRDLEDRNPIPGDKGQDYHIQLNMQTVGEEPDPALKQLSNRKPKGAAAQSQEGQNAA